PYRYELGDVAQGQHWAGAVEISRRLVAGGGTAWLRYIRRGANPALVFTANADDPVPDYFGDEPTGIQLINAWETY
ncbi:hypothetical protein, partial [Methylobacterium crusticola]|uniref:hypothetical protein n=1 Tax=Methylobacterium crusticola TaxID=1697972 RepID=UPI001EE2E795